MVFDIKTNPNEDELKDIVEAVDANEGYCPCAVTKDADTKCMCKAFRDSENTDFCHCGRFYKVRDHEILAVIGDISDEDMARNYTDWCESLIYQDFIPIGIPLNPLDYHFGSEKYMNIGRAIIAKSDAVLVLGHGQEMTDVVTGLVDWASMIGKKVLTREDLMK